MIYGTKCDMYYLERGKTMEDHKIPLLCERLTMFAGHFYSPLIGFPFLTRQVSRISKHFLEFVVCYCYSSRRSAVSQRAFGSRKTCLK